MPAAAVIPAPIAYIKVVAVKKLVVGFWARALRSAARRALGACAFLLEPVRALWWVCSGFRTFTVKKLECLKQACA